MAEAVDRAARDRSRPPPRRPRSMNRASRAGGSEMSWLETAPIRRFAIRDRLAHAPEDRALRLALRDQRVARQPGARAPRPAPTSSRPPMRAAAGVGGLRPGRSSRSAAPAAAAPAAASPPGRRGPAALISSKAESVPPSAARSACSSSSAAAGRGDGDPGGGGLVRERDAAGGSPR